MRTKWFFCWFVRPLALAISLIPLSAHVSAQSTSPTVLIGDVEWRQLTDTTPLSWDEVATVCPPGGGECNGSVNGIEFNGWSWATAFQVSALFNYFRPTFPILDDQETDIWQLRFRDAFDLPDDALDRFFDLFDVNGWQGVNGDLPYVGGWVAEPPTAQSFGGLLGLMPMVGVFDYDNPCCTSPFGEFSTVMLTSANWNGIPRFPSSPTLLRGAWLYRIIESAPCGVASVLSECCPEPNNHGQYVSCVAKALSDLRDEGEISGRERGAMQSQAARDKGR
jgi:hypothetical protein